MKDDAYKSFFSTTTVCIWMPILGRKYIVLCVKKNLKLQTSRHVQNACLSNLKGEKKSLAPWLLLLRTGFPHILLFCCSTFACLSMRQIIKRSQLPTWANIYFPEATIRSALVLLINCPNSFYKLAKEMQSYLCLWRPVVYNGWLAYAW